MSVPFAEQVAAVTPLNGVIDGSPRPKPRPAKPLRRERRDASRTFFCRNANCDHATWSEIAQARHMHAEFVWAMEALVMRAPESPEALVLTGGVILAELTDDECRAACAERSRLRKAGALPLEIPTELRLRIGEYERRRTSGILTRAERRTRRAPLKETCKHGHPFSGDNLHIGADGKRHCRQCAREQTLARWHSNPAYRERANERARDRRQQSAEYAEQEREYGREWYRERMKDPARREQLRERSREAARRRRADPEVRARKNAQDRESYVRKKAEATEVT